MERGDLKEQDVQLSWAVRGLREKPGTLGICILTGCEPWTRKGSFDLVIIIIIIISIYHAT